MYIYVSEDFNNVILSKTPKPEYGTPILSNPERHIVRQGGFISQNGRELVEMVQDKNGHYIGAVDIINDEAEFTLYSRKLPISSQEPERAGSYAIQSVTDGIFDFSNGFIEVDVAEDRGINTNTPRPFVIKFPKDRWYNCSISLDLDNNKLYAADLSGYYVLPIISDETPTVETASAWNARRIYNGGLINIPAGEFDVWLYSREMLSKPDRILDISFTESPVVHSSDGFQGYRLKNDAWRGGKIYLDAATAVDLSQVKTVKILQANEDEASCLTETAPGSLIYKGLWRVPETDNGSTSIPSLQFELIGYNVENWDGESSYRNITIGAPNVRLNAMSDRCLTVDNGEAHSRVEFNSAPIMLNNVVNGAFEVTLNLNNMTLDLRQIEGRSVDLYEVYAQSGSVIDGATSYIDRESEIPVIATSLIDTDEAECEFNLMNNKSVISPEGGKDVEIVFDENGVWVGKYAETTVIERSNTSERSVRRAASDANAKWHFSMPEKVMTQLSMMIDESAKTIAIFSMAHNTGFFMVDNCNDDDTTIYPKLTNLELANAHRLMSNQSGVYKGFIVFNEDETQKEVLFMKNLQTQASSEYGITFGYFSSVQSRKALDLTAGNSTSIEAWDSWESPFTGCFTPYEAECLTINAHPGKYEVRYDAKNHVLNLTESIEDNIDRVVDDLQNNLQIISGVNEVTLISSCRQRVVVYSITGIAVRTLVVEPGETTLALAAGVYIIDRRKVAVK